MNNTQCSYRQNFDLFKILWGINLILLKLMLVLSQFIVSV